MRRKALVTTMAVTAMTIAAAGATNVALAGTRHGHGHSRAARPAPGASATARPPAEPTASAPASGSTSAPGSPSGSAAAAGSASAGASALTGKLFFDDFGYTSAGDARLVANGWSVRTGGGAPGVSGAIWSKDAITFTGDDATAGNTIMRLRASTAGTGASTVQAEISTSRSRFLAGTYAARVWFSDAPVSGQDGDAVNQTFFTITPLRYDDDPLYSELDFEYLPNGGWGASRQTMYLTSWYTYHNSPSWGGDRASGEAGGSLAGWHDVVMQVGNGTVTYFIDGIKVFSSTGKYYPRQQMAIDFNEWFIEGGLLGGGSTRIYEQRVDWVLHVADQLVPPATMSEQVSAYRSAGVGFRDAM